MFNVRNPSTDTDAVTAQSCPTLCAGALEPDYAFDGYKENRILYLGSTRHPSNSYWLKMIVTVKIKKKVSGHFLLCALLLF